MRLVVEEASVVGEAGLEEVLGDPRRLLGLTADEAGELVEGDRPLLGDQPQELELPGLGSAQHGSMAGAGAAAQLALAPMTDHRPGCGLRGRHHQPSSSR